MSPFSKVARAVSPKRIPPDPIKLLRQVGRIYIVNNINAEFSLLSVTVVRDLALFPGRAASKGSIAYDLYAECEPVNTLPEKSGPFFGTRKWRLTMSDLGWFRTLGGFLVLAAAGLASSSAIAQVPITQMMYVQPIDVCSDTEQAALRSTR